MNKFLLAALIIVSAMAATGCNSGSAINTESDKEYYCVVNQDIIGFYVPSTKTCTPFVETNKKDADYCKKIEEMYLKGKCRLKSEACHEFGRGESHEIGCFNSKEESLRILTTPTDK